MLLGLLWMALSFLVGLLGCNRAFGFWGWFFYALLFSPLFAFIMLLLAAPKNRTA